MILSKLASSRLHLCTPVKSVKNASSNTHVVLTTADGREEVYDHVIMACHSDIALSILKEGGDIRPEEEKILGMFKWNKNESVLHSDTRVRVVWSIIGYGWYNPSNSCFRRVIWRGHAGTICHFQLRRPTDKRRRMTIKSQCALHISCVVSKQLIF